MRKITIVIVDDHAMVRESLALVLNQMPGFEVIAHCDNGDETMSLIAELLPTILLVDIHMRPLSGFQLAEEVLHHFPRQKILAISATSLVGYAKRMLKIGGKGYVSKNTNSDELQEAILTVANGYTFISSDILKQMDESSSVSPDDTNTDLSVRELEVVREIANGSSSKEIAERLGITIKTVEVHRQNVMRKTGAKNTAALMMFMITQGLT